MSRLHASRRGGFTLPELLVVITIAGILLALTASAVHRFTGGALRSATRTTLHRLDDTLRKRIATLNDRTRSRGIPDAVKAIEPEDPDRQKVIFLKLRMKRYFPVTFAEVFNPTPGLTGPETGPVPAYVKFLNDNGINAGNVGTLPVDGQSAVCLLMTMKFGPDGVGEDELAVGGSTKPIDFGNGIQAPGLVDGWGRPLTFCRWPSGAATSGSSAIYPGGYATGYTDPADPRNTLVPWATGAPQNGYFVNGGVFHQVPSPRPANNSRPVVLSPVIVSWGADGKIGLDPLTLQSTGTDSDDNLYSVEIK